jgi:exportin-7
MNIGRHTAVIERIIRRLAINLQDWGGNDDIIGQTLEVFTSFVCGYSSGRMLLELDTVKYIIDKHSDGNFTFLTAKSPKISDHRAQFFTALSRLIWLQDGA